MGRRFCDGDPLQFGKIRDRVLPGKERFLVRLWSSRLIVGSAALDLLFSPDFSLWRRSHQKLFFNPRDASFAAITIGFVTISLRGNCRHLFKGIRRSALPRGIANKYGGRDSAGELPRGGLQVLKRLEWRFCVALQLVTYPCALHSWLFWQPRSRQLPRPDGLPL
jgi:hypothetical protein